MSTIAEIAAELASALTTNTTRAIAYCRTCSREISAQTAAENGGNCNAHAHEAVGVRWQASDDWRP